MKCDFCGGSNPIKSLEAKPFYSIADGNPPTTFFYDRDWLACLKCSFAIELGDTKQLWDLWLDEAKSSPTFKDFISNDASRTYLEGKTKGLYQLFMRNWLGKSRNLTEVELKPELKPKPVEQQSKPTDARIICEFCENPATWAFKDTAPTHRRDGFACNDCYTNITSKDFEKFTERSCSKLFANNWFKEQLPNDQLGVKKALLEVHTIMASYMGPWTRLSV